MAYSASGLNRIGGDSNRSLWMYVTADAIAAVNTRDYFLSAINMIKVGDVMITVTSTGGTVVCGHTYFTENDGTNIDCVDGVAITASDGD
tara:strand:+ start:355 stop:624 length:270 start_codon:yes stop_codon:yes gene_type:complete